MPSSPDAARSLCILVADRPAQLPATVLSRCQQIPLAVENRNAANTWLLEQLPSGIDPNLALDEARGAPLRAVRECNPEWHAQLEIIDKAWWSLLLHQQSVGRIVESLKDVPTKVCLARFLKLAAVAVHHRQGTAHFAPIKALSEEQTTALVRLNSVNWFTIHDQLLHLHRIDSASFKTQTVLEGFLADTRLKITG